MYADVLRHLIVQRDLSAYGLVNAVTYFSQDAEDYDRATEFEALGGRLIDLSSSEWGSGGSGLNGLAGLRDGAAAPIHRMTGQFLIGAALPGQSHQNANAIVVNN